MTTEPVIAGDSCGAASGLDHDPAPVAGGAQALLRAGGGAVAARHRRPPFDRIAIAAPRGADVRRARRLAPRLPRPAPDGRSVDGFDPRHPSLSKSRPPW